MTQGNPGLHCIPNKWSFLKRQLQHMDMHLQGFIQDFWGGIKYVRTHITHTLMTFWKFIELHLNLNSHTTVSINTVHLFIHCAISIVYIIIMITSY